MNFRFKVTARSKVKRVHFIQNTYGKMQYGMFSLKTALILMQVQLFYCRLTKNDFETDCSLKTEIIN